MGTYVMLSTLTENGAKTIKENPDRIMEVDREMTQFGVKVLHQFAVLGAFDFVTILEAPDNVAVARASLELGSRGSVRVTTLAAIPVEELVEGLGS